MKMLALLIASGTTVLGVQQAQKLLGPPSSAAIEPLLYEQGPAPVGPAPVGPGAMNGRLQEQLPDTDPPVQLWTPENSNSFPSPPSPPPPVPSLQRARLLFGRGQDKVPGTGDPIWRLQVVQGNRVITELPALTGMASRQNVDRHISGTKAPLPAGRYAITREGIERGPFAEAELGSGYWVPIEPLFKTARSYLGIHQDPSWGRKNNESGTSGCIGLQSAEATVKLAQLIDQYDIRELIVVN